MKKKLVSMLITVMFAVTIVGCGADSTEDAYSVVHEGITGEQAEADTAEKGSAEGSLEEQNGGEKESAGGSSVGPNTGEGTDVTSKGQHVGDKEGIAGTSSNKNSEDKQITQGQGNAAEANTTKSNENSGADVKSSERMISETTDLTFADLSKLRFEFSSGAGGWWEEFTIERDGYFTGVFVDNDLGVTGEGYEEGTRFSSVYSGHFTELTKINDYTYQMKLKDISYKETVGKEEIRDNMLHVYLTSYCLGANDTFTIYLPGTPVEQFSEEVRSWLFLMNQPDTELTKVAIVDEKNQYGICSYERMAPLEDAQTTYKSYKESYDYYSSLIPDANSNMEWLEYTGMMYELADDCLNYIWNLVRYNVPEEEYEVILEEQREWIAEKEAQAEADAAEFGGSFAMVAYNDTLAEMTIERCEELIKYLK